MIILESSGKTDVGKKRKGNEDSFFLDDNMKFYLVADGMGGHQAGEVASKLVADSMSDYMKRSAKNKEFKNFDESLSKSANRILSGIALANRVVNQIAGSRDLYRGMGSTLSAVYFSDETLIAANVGDSPIYLVRDGTIDLLSVPHTVLAEKAAIDPEGAKSLGPQFSHMLTRAMGTHDNVKPDICEIQCFKNDIIIISSDGLSDKVAPIEIKDIVTKEPPETATQILIDLANERGGDDNITIIVLLLKNVKQNNNRFMNFFKKLFRRKNY